MNRSTVDGVTRCPGLKKSKLSGCHPEVIKAIGQIVAELKPFKVFHNLSSCVIFYRFVFQKMNSGYDPLIDAHWKKITTLTIL